jgi:hypothetical protein
MATVQKAIAIPEPTDAPDALWRTTQALKEAVEVLQGIRGNRAAALLCEVQELIDGIQYDEVAGGPYAPLVHTHLLTAGATDVTAVASEVNLLDLSGLTVGWGLIADSATTASWQVLPAGSIPTHTGEVTGDTNLSLDVTAITNQTELTSTTIEATDELVVSDTTAGTLARADAAALTDAGNF